MYWGEMMMLYLDLIRRLKEKMRMHSPPKSEGALREDKFLVERILKDIKDIPHSHRFKELEVPDKLYHDEFLEVWHELEELAREWKSAESGAVHAVTWVDQWERTGKIVDAIEKAIFVTDDEDSD